MQPRRPSTPTLTSSRRVRTLAAALVVVGTLAACDGPATTAPTSTVVPSPPAPPSAVDDGVLTIAVLVPESGRGAPLGTSLVAGARLAVDEIDRSGGVLSRPVRMVVRAELDDAGAMAATYRSLADDGVDAVVGPTSSTVALATLQAALDADMISCSPTASTLALDEFPDGARFFRTIPSDSLQAVALAREVERSGARDAAIVHLDDDYGRPLARQASAALTAAGVAVMADLPFDTTEASTRALAARLAALDPDVVLVIADADAGGLLIDATDAIGAGLTFVVNDAQRRPDQGAAFVEGRVSGVGPASAPTSPEFLQRVRTIDPAATGWFAANAYDCVNLIALAALAAGSTRPGEIAGLMRAVSTSGTSCASAIECAPALVAGRNIDYDGPNDDLDLGSDGDPVRARFERFQFDASGVDITVGTFAVTPVDE
jgi:branched-chain amino acid transport system substrate-binding protein